MILADLTDAIKVVRNHADTVEATRWDDWRTKMMDIENAINKLVEKLSDAEAHLEACLNEIEASMAFIAD